MPTTRQAQQISEVIHLEAVLNLPKGTEHFVSDLHGEFEAFDHILRNGSGRIREKVCLLFNQELSEAEIDELCFIIYYPEEKLDLLQQAAPLSEAWWTTTIKRLVEMVRFSSMKYTRAKVRQAFPKAYDFLLEELIYPYDQETTKQSYYQQLIAQIILTEQAVPFITALAYLIQRLVIDHLHVMGDIYDRGPAPDKIMERLIHYHSVDIQLGNHDIIWLGAFSGSKACLANVIRICARYGHLQLLEQGYGIDLTDLKTFSNQMYQQNHPFYPKDNPYETLPDTSQEESMRIQQALAIIQEKLEGQIIQRRPDFHLKHRLRLDKIDGHQIVIDKTAYPLVNCCFQTVDPQAPFCLTEAEAALIDDLLHQFQQSATLKRHMDFLMSHGALYLVYNHNLLIHGCIPLNEDGTFQAYTFQNQQYAGKELVDFFQKMIDTAYQAPEETEDYATDCLWYLWCGEGSSLFGKQAMKTFERYFIADQTTHVEIKNPYYALRANETVCQAILDNFGVTGKNRHIFNGHTPVKLKKGESPIKGNGTLLVIDGGFSKSYQKVTGIAGYTLLFNSFGLQLVAHKPFINKQLAIQNNQDIHSIKQVVDRPARRLLIRDTTLGQQLARQVTALQAALSFTE
ncbi:fructose-1,6-bisphosphatase [Enterococcus faecalis]